jgi:predicted molibdopterin-dependent oxidoreductase YjgC
MERGMATKVSTPASLSLKEAGCSFCGTCIQVCPTGARIEWGRRGCGKEWELSKKETLCPYCNLGCKIRVFTKDERTVRVDAIDAFICAKARFGFDAFSSDRLSTPLARRDGKLEEVEDEEALEFLAKEILRIKEEGEGLISFIGNGSFSIEDNYVLEKIARDVIGTENFASIHSSSSLQANYLPKVDDLWHCDLIFLIGEDVRWIAPVLFKKMEEVAKRGKKIFLINQRKIPKTPFLHIFCRSGVEHYLLLGLLKMLSEEALFKDKNMEQLKEIKMEEILEITGSKIDELKECIEAIRGAERVAFLYTPYFSLQDHAEGILESLLLPPSITIFPILPEPNILNRSLKRREEIIEMIKDARAIIALGDIPKALKDVMREDAFFCLFTTHLTEEMKERADFLFPSPAPHEADGTFLNLVGKIRIKGMHDQIPLWQYLCKLSSLLGYSIKYEDVTEAIEKIKEERRGEAFERIVLKRFSPSSEYPFTLIAEGALSPLQEVWIKNSRVQKIYDLLYLSPKDAEKMQIKDEDEVFLSSKRGRIKAKVKIDEDIEEGVLKLPYFLASPLFEFHTCIEQVKLEKA